MENELVRYSRAGDVFHYRWAARRCLRMIHPKSQLRYIVIEGSKEREKAGEYVIDVAEYSGIDESTINKIVYYQLKHTTVRKEKPFTLSDLKNTFEGFGKRYSEYFCKKSKTDDSSIITFSIVTNRPISHNLKNYIFTIGKGKKVLNKNGKESKRFQNTLEKYTNLQGKHLKAFCASIKFADGEGDYNAQRYELHVEISQLLAGTIDNPQIINIADLVQEKALPHSDGKIIREDILKRFGVTSERGLFPAPPEFEKIDDIISREQYEILLDCIFKSSMPTIIHAAGGVGKTVFARHIVDLLPKGSLGIVYDCFGGGRYRNRSELRHRHRDALVQIVNELAIQGLCDPIIAQSTALEDEILRKFLRRLNSAVKSLKKANTDSFIVILIDAADNAEMAAREFAQPCFAHELLRETIPDGCKLVMLCRTERIHLLQPSSTITKVELEPFSEEESLNYLRTHFPQATDAEGLEFHRLTSGNPRVQANALNMGFDTIVKTLDSFGPLGSTVEEQIEAQLDSAISTLKEKLSPDYQSSIDAICLGLANLPPFIPIKVLAKVAEVDEATVKSFIADLGRPLWLSDRSVHFRDEPTETWFRKKFSATVEQIASYITFLKPLANEYPYVAETLPSLLLQAEKYTELIDLALSDELLPTDNPIDERNIRVYRLQFAFKAALKLKRYVDAMKLALRAGEEVAGDRRQLKLLKENVDLIAPLQSEQRVQELAFRRILQSGWDGSENVYSAALLSSVEDFKGEARVYLRAANNWLRLYFDEHEKSDEQFRQNKLKDDDVAELIFAHFNLFKITQTVNFMLSWRPPEVIYNIAQKFIRRLVDANDFKSVNKISQIGSNNPYLMIALADELLSVGRFPFDNTMEHCLDLFATNQDSIPKSNSYEDASASAVLSFFEACASRKLSKTKILQALNHYIPVRDPHYIGSQNIIIERERHTYLRAVALRSVFSGNFEPNIDELLPEEFVGQEKYKHDQDIRVFKEIVGGLLPWYIVRARVLIGAENDIFEFIKRANQQSKDALRQRWHDPDPILYEISRVYIEILILYQNPNNHHIEEFFTNYLQGNNQIRIQDRLRAVRAAFRLDHLSKIRSQLEQSVYTIIVSATSEGPDTKSDWYIDLARAVLPVCKGDAAVYFNYAVEAVSKFGDEIVERWNAVVALANRSADGRHSTPEMAYRFIRCAELVGDNVGREKYWDRNEAISVCARLSPGSALSALSRWRDRQVGWFYQQLPALADELVSSTFISPSVGWSLSAFFEGYGLDDFASLCIEKERSMSHRQHILDVAVRDLSLNEAEEKSWRKLKEVAQKHSIKYSKLDDILNFYSNNPKKSNEEFKQQNSELNCQSETESVDWEKILNNLDLTTTLGINQAIKNFNASSVKYRDYETFWQKIFKRIGENEISKFLQALVDIENTNWYDLRRTLSILPENWKCKISVKQIWPKILEKIARRFASEFTKYNALEYFLRDIQIENDEMASIRNGILQGLSSSNDIADANTFWGFSKIISPLLSPQEASGLLDFALNRFELHIEDEYADGNWSTWLIPPDNVSMAFAGFIWSTLGSPRAEARWRATHCVRRLVEGNCEREINALLQWMERGDVGAFGCHRFPFYNLHARLYLLIALARTSNDNPEILKKHHNIFLFHALRNMPHILIQKFSTEIALNIEKAFPNTYSADIIEQLRQVAVSQLPINNDMGYYDKIVSYWHQRGEVDTSLKFYHSYDFDRYWFQPLGEVFGISAKQVEELATEIAIKEWHIKLDGSYKSEPRLELWRSPQNEQETWHTKRSYPRVDDYRFYISYHAMFVVAARLLAKMSVVHRRELYEDEWAEWLHRHLLTRHDGCWLADRRDPAPLSRPNWIHQDKTENWRSEIISIDFLDAILFEQNEETWLNVFGFWEEGDNIREESFYVSTALVAPAASQSLLNSLTTYSNPHDFKLPEYEEERVELETYPFELKGWVGYQDQDNRLDKFDPFAGDIDFPPYQIGKSIVEKLGLTVDSEQRECFLPNEDKASVRSEIWKTNKPSKNEGPLRHGKRLSASLTFLKKLCLVLGFDLIFNVKINRRFKSYMRDEDDTRYRPPYSKIYIFTPDGKLRDTETYYQLR